MQGLTNSTRLTNGCGHEFQTQVSLTAFSEIFFWSTWYTNHAVLTTSTLPVCNRTDTNRKRCNKHFPQPFRSNATINDKSGRVEYTRVKSTNDRPTVRNFFDGKWTNVPVDEWVASYNLLTNAFRLPYSCWRSDCNCLRNVSLQMCTQRRGLRQSKNPRDRD